MPRYAHHAKQVRSILSGTRQESGPEAVSPEICRIKSRLLSILFDDISDAVRGECIRHHLPAFRHAAEQGAFCNARRFHPSVYRYHWAGTIPSNDGNNFPAAFLICFRVAHMNPMDRIHAAEDESAKLREAVRELQELMPHLQSALRPAVAAG